MLLANRSSDQSQTLGFFDRTPRCRPDSADQMTWCQSWTDQLAWSFAQSSRDLHWFRVSKGVPTLECWLIPALSNTRCTVLGLSGRAPVPYLHNSASVCQEFFRTFRIIAIFSLWVKPLLSPLRVGAPSDAPLSFKCFLINRLTVVRGTHSCREIAE